MRARRGPRRRAVRCRPARARVGYQVVYFDPRGRQVAWAPDGPQRTRTLALRHLDRKSVV